MRARRQRWRRGPANDHLALTVTWDNFASLWQDDLYLRAYLNSLKIAAISTVFCLLLGYPMALAIARATRQTRNIMLLVVVLPFWTPFLLRVYAWLGILDTNGLLNRFLQCNLAWRRPRIAYLLGCRNAAGKDRSC